MYMYIINNIISIAKSRLKKKIFLQTMSKINWIFNCAFEMSVPNIILAKEKIKLCWTREDAMLHQP